MTEIRPVVPHDHLDISVLVTSAFRQPNEQRMLERLRAAGAVSIELVSEEPAGLLGHIALSRMSAPENWLALGPVCVRPQNAGQGIGSALIIEALDRARRGGFTACVVVGDPRYYKRLGFVFGARPRFNTPFPLQYTGFYWLRHDPIDTGPEVTLVYPDAFTEA